MQAYSEVQMSESKPSTPPVQRMVPAKWWLTRCNTGLIQRADRHDDWWYDPEAIMSRKPSVRFRRSVDIQLPVYNEQVRVLFNSLSFVRDCWTHKGGFEWVTKGNTAVFQRTDPHDD
jgi:hypothetical protein